MLLVDLFFYFLLSFISYQFPFFSIYLIPFLCYLNIINILSKKNYIIILYFFIFSFLFFLPIVIWCYYYNDVDIVIFVYFLILCLFFASLYLFFVYSIKRFILIINNKHYRIFLVIFSNTFLHYCLYNIGYLFTPGCVFPIYYIITPLSYFGFFGLPFFSYDYFFVYFFIYQIIIYYIFQNKYLIVLYFFYSIICLINIPNVDYYWDKGVNLSFDLYLYNNKYIFPEHMFFINNINDIDFLRIMAKNEKREIIAGVGWYERINDKLIEKNGVLYIDLEGVYFIYEKYHYLRFCETKNKYFYLKKNLNRKKNILICSEFFLRSISKMNHYIVASTKWTDTYITFFYKNIMKRIYNMHFY